MELTRRDALAGALAALAAPASRARGAGAGSVLYIPGYDADAFRADPVACRALPRGYGGPATLVTRIGLNDGAVEQAVYPVQGHVIAVDRVRRRGVLHSQSRDWFVVFDTETLDLVASSAPFAEGFVGGGHALFTGAGEALLTTERAPYGPYLGSPEAHFGRIVIRDPETLAEIGRVGSHGIAPHDLALIEDGRVLAVANYGSPAPRSCRAGELRPTVAPSLAFIDLASGRLLERIETGPGSPEIRHFAAAARDDLMVIRVDQGEAAALAARLGNAAPPDETASGGCVYLPAAPLSVAGAGEAAAGAAIGGAPDARLRQGLSVAFDPVHDRYLATYPSSHAILVVGRRSHRVERVIDTAALGLDYPCGLALDPGQGRYLVAGAFGPIMAFSLDTHAPRPGETIAIRLHRHSHIALA